MTQPPQHPQVPLPGSAHPAFDEAFVEAFMGRQVGADGTIKIVTPTGVITTFRSATIVMPYAWVVWIDERGRGIAQAMGVFTHDTFNAGDLRTSPVFRSGAHIEMPIQQGPPQ